MQHVKHKGWEEIASCHFGHGYRSNAEKFSTFSMPVNPAQLAEREDCKLTATRVVCDKHFGLCLLHFLSFIDSSFECVFRGGGVFF